MKLLEESFGAGTRAKAPRLHGDRQKYGLVLVHRPHSYLYYLKLRVQLPACRDMLPKSH